MSTLEKGRIKKLKSGISDIFFNSMNWKLPYYLILDIKEKKIHKLMVLLLMPHEVADWKFFITL